MLCFRAPKCRTANAFGEYDLSAEEMAEHIAEWAQAGFLNLVGGCCGTTPEHIAAIAKAVEGVKPRATARSESRMSSLGFRAAQYWP